MKKILGQYFFMKKCSNKNIQRIIESAVFLCYSLPLDYYTKTVTFGNS